MMFYQCTFTTGKRNYLLQFCGYLKKDYRKILEVLNNRKEEPESEEPDFKKNLLFMALSTFSSNGIQYFIRVRKLILCMMCLLSVKVEILT